MDKSTLWGINQGGKKLISDMEKAIPAKVVEQIEACGWLPITVEMSDSQTVQTNNSNRETNSKLSNIVSGLTKQDVLVQFGKAGKNNGVIVHGPGCVQGRPKQFAVWLNPSLNVQGIVKGIAIAAARVVHGTYKVPTESPDTIGKVQYTYPNGVGGTGKVSFDGTWVVSRGITKIEATDTDGVVTLLTVDAESLQEAQMYAEVINERDAEKAEKAETKNTELMARVEQMNKDRIKREAQDVKNAEKMAEMKAKIAAYELSNAA